MWIELYIRIGVNAETIVWRVRSPLCAQVYFREQRVPESFTRTALLLSLRWGADGRVGQPEGRRHWWVSSFSTYALSTQQCWAAVFQIHSDCVNYQRFVYFLICVFHQGLWWSLIQTPSSSQVSDSGYNGWGECYSSKCEQQHLHFTLHIYAVYPKPVWIVTVHKYTFREMYRL